MSQACQGMWAADVLRIGISGDSHINIEPHSCRICAYTEGRQIIGSTDDGLLMVILANNANAK